MKLSTLMVINALGFVARLGTEPGFPGPREDHPTR
jgi:hypothetical protein